MINKFKFAGLCALVAVILTGCDMPEPTADQKEQKKQEAMQAEAVNQVGMPGITRFSEKRLLAKIYEAKDKTLLTYTYVPDMNNNLAHVCDSWGMGFSGGTQFSNPQKIVTPYYGSTYHPMIQAQSEPNGLYPPAVSEGTMILCITPRSGKLVPIEVEPRTIRSAVKLNFTKEWMTDPEQLEKSPVKFDIPKD